MDFELTAGTQRAIEEASRWSMDGSQSLLQAPSLLLGLMSEPECRAALLLEEHGIDAESVRARWPDLAPTGSSDPGSPAPSSNEGESDGLVPRFSPETEAAIAIARNWLVDLPQPFTLATEHLLMGLAASDHEVGHWLQTHDLDAEALRAEILKQYGMSELPLEIEEIPAMTLAPAKPKETPYPTDIKLVTSPTDTACRRANVAEPSSDANLVRLLDASANRAREALRVVEDHVRFVLDDRHLTERLKWLRHRLTSALGEVSMSDRLAMRDTRADVGTSVSTATERVRQDVDDVLTANFTRLHETLRSLEEFGKIGTPEMSQLIEQIRYDTYTLHKAVHGTVEGLDRLRGKRLYVLVDGQDSVDTFEELVSSLVEAGVDILQLRDKTLGDRELLDRARRLRTLTASSETLFVMNDRADLAVLAGADGIHVGQEELSVRDVRQIVGPRMLVGVSTHNLEQARQAVLDGAGYLGVGPTFPSETKAFTEFPGLEFARRVASEIRLPAFAIGGIGAANLGEVLATGMERVAVSGAVVSAEAPARAARDLLDRLKASP